MNCGPVGQGASAASGVQGGERREQQGGEEGKEAFHGFIRLSRVRTGSASSR